MKNKILTICIVILYIILGRYLMTFENNLMEIVFRIYSMFFIIGFGYGIYSLIKKIDE